MPIQTDRSIAIGTPLDEEALILTGFSGTEQLGRPFQYRLELLSEDFGILFQDIVGENVTVRLDLADDQTRYFNGFVSRFVQTYPRGRYARYEAEVVPWLWFLTRTSDCRIFQEMTVPDIIMQVFRDHGFTDFEDRLTGNYATWDYCVQYRETDFSFVSRLMEQEGIYYYFQHENGKHTLVLCDSMGKHEAYEGYEQIPFRPLGDQSHLHEKISTWTLEQQIQPGVFAHSDFDFESPKKALRTSSSIAREHAVPDFEIYDYPGEFTEFDDGESYARVRIEEIQSQFEVVRAETEARGICPGFKFELTDHPREDQCREYLVTSASYRMELDEFDAVGEPAGRGPIYSSSFTGISTEESFRPARLTPKPVIQGPQTAIVVGSSGEEIHTDEYGRVKVQFHWDRYGEGNENSSCWIRVSQPWAGKKWGFMYVPRIGQEVIVEFLEGDPDRPLITGRVYNGEAMPPYDLPANKTISTIKSNSSKGGGGFNEIRFEDKKGDEQIFIYAQKNQDLRINNNEYETVGNDRHLVVGNDQVEHVKNNREELVDNDHIEEVGNDRNLKVGGKEAREIGGSHSFVVKGDVIEEFKGNHSEQVSSDYYLKGSNIVIEGSSNVTIKVGQSYVAIESSGIKIGTTGQIELEATSSMALKATGSLAMESSATAELKSPMTTVKGDGMLTVSGGLVKIN